jgi:aldehyde dehydrogenase (NAD+)
VIKKEKSMPQTTSILKTLGIQSSNPGACYGPHGWIEEDGSTSFASLNPATGEALAHVVPASERGYETVVAKLEAGFQTWQMVPAPRRGLVVRDIGARLRELKEPLGDLVSLEMGKIRGEGHGEVQEMIDMCDFAVGLSRQLYGLSMHSERPGHRMYEQWHPLGIVGVISAFNFPVAVWSWNAAIALVCGDAVLWKPSSSAPLTAIAVQQVCNRVVADHGFDGILGLVVGPGHTVGERLIHDRRIPLVSFTGSTEMGRRVSETVARRLGRTILEMGGNNAVIVTQHADLENATRAILFGTVGTAGQRCTSTRRVIVQRSVALELTKRLVSAYHQVRVGDPLDEGTLMGPLVNGAAVEAMQRAIEQARAEGGEVLIGGDLLPECGDNFVRPAIIKMAGQTPIVKTETFAPILYLLEYETLDEALALHNDVPQGLSSAIFTEDLMEAELFLSHRGSDCGIANVNTGTSGAEIGGAFGGEKETGGGREAGSDAWKAYMRRQTNTINWSQHVPLAQGIRFDVSS